MTPRRLHRWKTFWLGVLATGFLGWAWLYSMTHTTGVLWLTKGRTITAGQSAGQVFLNGDSSLRFTGSLPTYEPQWVHERISTAGEPRFPTAFVWETYPNQIQITIAHWLLILLFLIPWSALLAWRWWRMRKRLRDGMALAR